MTHPERVEPVAPPLVEISSEQRRGILAGQVSSHVHNGYRVESQTDVQAILVKGRRPSHLLHLALSVLTLGVWALLVWLPLALFGGERRRSISVDPFGVVITSKGRG